MSNIQSAATTICFIFVLASLGFAQGGAAFVLPGDVQSVITSHCVDCHGADTAEADVRLDNVATLELDARLELLNKVQDQLFFGTMPPADETQPTSEERTRVADWVREELRTTQRFEPRQESCDTPTTATTSITKSSSVAKSRTSRSPPLAAGW